MCVSDDICLFFFLFFFSQSGTVVVVLKKTMRDRVDDTSNVPALCAVVHGGNIEETISVGI